MASVLIVFIRLLVPFSILRWPFWGALLAIAADASDVVILDALGWGFFEGKNYHAIDKFFDTYYLAFEFYASRLWLDVLTRKAAAVFFLWRVLGVAAFEITRVRQIMFLAPNIFENFYLLVAGARKFFPVFRIDTLKKLAAFVVIASVPKLIQEYIMHYLEFPTWAFIKHNIFRWR